jgi:hypothetical protein
LDSNIKKGEGYNSNIKKGDNSNIKKGDNSNIKKGDNSKNKKREVTPILEAPRSIYL